MPTLPHKRHLGRTFFCLSLLLGAAAGTAANSGPSLELIMSDPDWIGNAPESPWWGEDSASVYYRAKRIGEDIRDTYRVSSDTAAERLAPGDRVFQLMA